MDACNDQLTKPIIYDKHGTRRFPPRYKCHKEVYAFKIKDIVVANREGWIGYDPGIEEDNDFAIVALIPEEDQFGPIMVDAEWRCRHHPQIGGYYVIYTDGYTSYSPVTAFEQGYARIES